LLCSVARIIKSGIRFHSAASGPIINQAKKTWLQAEWLGPSERSAESAPTYEGVIRQSLSWQGFRPVIDCNMKKSATSAIATAGLFLGTFLCYGQAAGGGTAATAGTGTTSGVGTSGVQPGTAVGARSAGTTAPQPGTVTPRATVPNTIGAAGINQPATTPPIGGGSVITPTPNTIGGSTVVSPSPGAPGTAVATLPSPGAGAVPLNTLPAAVQNSLQSFATSGTLGSISPVVGPNGSTIYRVNVLQNGAAVELQVAPTGQILSRGPSVGGTAQIAGVGQAQAGLPVTALPTPVQNTLRTQLGANAQVQTVSRDDLANGSVFRVTALQNGTPTEFRFAANGTLLSSTPVTGAATSFVTPATPLIPSGGAVLFGDLPVAVQNTIRDQTGNGRINRITPQNTANGTSYMVMYDQNGRPMRMLLGPDGTVLRNEPMAVGTPAGRATGVGAGTTSTNSPSTNTTRTSSVSLEDVPESVRTVLEREATPYAQVRSINREERLGTDVYTVSIRSEDELGTLVIDQEGKILEDTRRSREDLARAKVTSDDELENGIPFSRAPLAIQNSIKAYGTAADIRSITLGREKDGKTVYDVVFYRDGRRDRMIVAKNGDLVRLERNVSPALELRGSPQNTPTIAIGDLPQQVQDTIRRQTDNVTLSEINTAKVGNESVYRVKYETNGQSRELFVGRDGSVVLPRARTVGAGADQPLPAPVPSETEEVVRVVEPTDVAIGAAATAERGSQSNSDTPTGEPPPATVDLKDVPMAVQKTATKMAGSATIESITPTLGETGMVYRIGILDKGERREVRVNRDGVIQNKKTSSSEP
jgi:hypothetical protein